MRISDVSSDVCSSDLRARHAVNLIVARIFPMPCPLAQRMAHRPDMLGRTRRHVADAEMLEHAERDGGEEALRLRRPEEHDLIFIIGEEHRIDPARPRFDHQTGTGSSRERVCTYV